MEEQIAAVIAQAQVTNTFFAEAYYFLTIPLMLLIHVGFLSYEMGATRVKNVLSSGIKNLLAFAFTIVTFYFFGWWFYWALPTGFTGSEGYMAISGIAYANAIALPWGDSAQYMGPNMGDHASGVFWGAFALFAATTASIASGALIERITDRWFYYLSRCFRFVRLDYSRRLGMACRWMACYPMGLS